jgi:hypothetical protein
MKKRKQRFNLCEADTGRLTRLSKSGKVAGGFHSTFRHSLQQQNGSESTAIHSQKQCNFSKTRQLQVSITSR